MFLFLLAIVASSIRLSRLEELGPISTCTFEGELIADKGSCTRYYKCRMDDVGAFVNDLLVCPDNSVFDMVTSLCNETTKNYWQDPTSCTKFYGCHATRQTSEGYIRQQYFCSGQLRFHPIERHCTFKTRVPDILCNSRAEEQTIIGTDEIYLNRNFGLSTRNLPLSTRELPSSPLVDAMSQAQSSSRSGFRTSPSAVQEIEKETTPSDEVPPEPAKKTMQSIRDVAQVAQAITEQLLRRRQPSQQETSKPQNGGMPDDVITHAQLEARDRITRV